jgi:hypothetical protein
MEGTTVLAELRSGDGLLSVRARPSVWMVADASAILAECPIRLLSLSIQESFRLTAGMRSIGSASETLPGNQRLCFTVGRVRARRRSGASSSILAATA